jgi:hypothetical protein
MPELEIKKAHEPKKTKLSKDEKKFQANTEAKAAEKAAQEASAVAEPTR